MRPVSRRVLLPAVAGLALACLELALRVVGFGDPVIVKLDPDIEYFLAPSRHYRRFGNDIAVNSFRMRSREIAPRRHPHEYRVLLIGDSIVYGDHLLGQRETLGAELEQRLGHLGCAVSVAAAAASSWGPANELAFVERFGFFDANAAVVVVSSHDQADYPTHNSGLFPYRLHDSWFATTDALTSLWTKSESILHDDSSKQLPFADRQRLSLGAFRTLVARATENAETTQVYVHPNRNEFKSADGSAVSVFRRSMPGVEGKLFALQNALQHSGKSATQLYQDNIHPTALGAQVIATAIATGLTTDVANKCHEKAGHPAPQQQSHKRGSPSNRHRGDQTSTGTTLVRPRW